MTGRQTLDDVLQSALDAMAHGTPPSEILARDPAIADELRPLLETAIALYTDAYRDPAPTSPRLAANRDVVGAAVQLERLADQWDMPRTPTRARWWRRRLVFASASIPAGVAVIFVMAGVGGAAAATTIAVSGNNPVAAVSHTISRATNNNSGTAPKTAATTSENADNARSSQQAFPPAQAHDEPPAADATLPPGSSSANAPRGRGTPAAGSTTERTPPGAGTAVGTKRVTLAGTVHDVRGNVFTLHTGDEDIQVNIDAETTVNGTLTDGAEASVSGSLTADKILHATAVIVASGGVSPDAPGSPTSTSTAVPTSTPTSVHPNNGNHGDGNNGNGGGDPSHGKPPTRTPEPE